MDSDGSSNKFNNDSIFDSERSFSKNKEQMVVNTATFASDPPENDPPVGDIDTGDDRIPTG